MENLNAPFNPSGNRSLVRKNIKQLTGSFMDYPLADPNAKPETPYTSGIPTFDVRF